MFFKNLISLKRIFFIFAFVFLSQNIFSFAIGNANFNTPTALNCISSKHFKILYPKGQEKFAILMRDYAEKSLEDINEYFGSPWEPKDFVITVTTDRKEFNAYYAFNHVVMFNTISGMEGSIYPENDFQDVLLHELGHAYILNHLSPTKLFFQNLIGSALDNSLYLNHLVTEGLSVALESGKSAGRLNYPMRTLNMHIGALSGKLYNYRQSSGADSASNPAAQTAYMLGGALFDYLRQTYGVEKFYKLIEGLKYYVSFPQLIQDVYQVPLSGIFNRLLASFRPVDAISTTPFTITPSRYSSLAVSGNDLYFYDKVSSKIFACTQKSSKSIIECDNLRKIAVSSNGVYILAIVSTPDGYNMVLYERNMGKYFEKYKIKSVEDAAFVKSNYGYDIALYRYDTKTMERRIEVVDLLSQEKKDELKLFDKNVVSITEFDNHDFAFILRDGTNYSLYIYSSLTSNLKKLPNENDYIYSDLSAFSTQNGPALALSFAEKRNWMSDDNFPRLLIFEKNNTDSWKMTTCADNLQGGVREPIFIGEKLFYIADNYADNRVRSIEKSELVNCISTSQSPLILSKNDFENSLNTDNNDYKAIAKSLKITHHDPFVSSLPFVSNHLLLPNAEYISQNDFGIGLMNISMDPSEQFHTFLSAMYHFGNKSRVQFEFESTILSRDIIMVFALNPSIKFDNSVSGNVHFDTTFAFTIDWKKYFRSSTNFFEFQSKIGYDLPLYKSKIYSYDGLSTFFAMQYVDASTAGYGYDSNKGFSTILAFSMNDSNDYFKKNLNMHFNPKANFEFILYIPFLLPLRNTRIFTFNLPTRLKLSAGYLYNMQEVNSKYGKHNANVSLSAETILFASRLVESEVDFPLLLKYFVVKFSALVQYDYYIHNSQSKTSTINGVTSSFSLSAYFDTSPSIAGLIITRSGTFSLGVKATLAQELPGMMPVFYITPVVSFALLE